MKKFAFVFPGQGSQAVGMLNSLTTNPSVRQTLEEASHVLGFDMAKLIAVGPKEQLDLTTNTQPVMLTAAIALFRAWNAAGGARPLIMAGHSLGEYSALVAGGALSFAEALPLVRFRAQAMQEAVPVGMGTMAAILGLSDDEVRAACAEAVVAHPSEVVQAVNFNAPAQVVIAGHTAAVARACEAAKARGAKRALVLPVSAPFHSSLLQPAADKLAERLKTVQLSTPEIPVIHNVDLSLAADVNSIRHALARQAASPVRWVETVQMMAAQGITHIVECGPGKVLAGLAKRIDANLTGEALFDQASLDKLVEELK